MNTSRFFATKTETINVMEFYNSFLQQHKHPLQRDPSVGVELLLNQLTFRPESWEGLVYRYKLKQKQEAAPDDLILKKHLNSLNEMDEVINGCSFVCYEVLLPSVDTQEVITYKGSYFGQLQIYYLPSENTKVQSKTANYDTMYGDYIQKMEKVKPVSPYFSERIPFHLKDQLESPSQDFLLPVILSDEESPYFVRTAQSAKHYEDLLSTLKENQNKKNVPISRYFDGDSYLRTKLTNVVDREKIRKGIHPEISPEEALIFCRTSSFVITHTITIPFITPQGTWIHFKGIETRITRTMSRSLGLHLNFKEIYSKGSEYPEEKRRALYRFGSKGDKIIEIQWNSYLNELYLVRQGMYLLQDSSVIKRLETNLFCQDPMTFLLKKIISTNELWKNSQMISLLGVHFLTKNSKEEFLGNLPQVTEVIKNWLVQKEKKIVQGNPSSIIHTLVKSTKVSREGKEEILKDRLEFSNEFDFFDLFTKNQDFHLFFPYFQLHYYLKMIVKKVQILFICENSLQERERNQECLEMIEKQTAVLEFFILSLEKFRKLKAKEVAEKIENDLKEINDGYLDSISEGFLKLLSFDIDDLSGMNKSSSKDCKKEGTKRMILLLSSFFYLVMTNDLGFAQGKTKEILDWQKDSLGITSDVASSKLSYFIETFPSLSSQETKMHTAKSDSHIRSLYEGCLVVELDYDMKDSMNIVEEDLQSNEKKCTIEKELKENLITFSEWVSFPFCNLPTTTIGNNHRQGSWRLICHSFEQVPSLSGWSLIKSTPEKDFSYNSGLETVLQQEYERSIFAQKLKKVEQNWKKWDDLQKLQEDHSYSVESEFDLDAEYSIVPFQNYLSVQMAKLRGEENVLISGNTLQGRNLVGLELIDFRGRLLSIQSFFYHEKFSNSNLYAYNFGLPTLNPYNYERILTSYDLKCLREVAMEFLKEERKRYEESKKTPWGRPVQEDLSKVRLTFSRKWVDSLERQDFLKSFQEVSDLVGDYMTKDSHLQDKIQVEKLIWEWTEKVDKLDWVVKQMLGEISSRQFLESYLYSYLTDHKSRGSQKNLLLQSLSSKGDISMEEISSFVKEQLLIKGVSFEVSIKLENSLLCKGFTGVSKMSSKKKFFDVLLQGWTNVSEQAMTNFTKVDKSSMTRLPRNRNSFKLSGISVESRISNEFTSQIGYVHSFRNQIEYGQAVESVADAEFSPLVSVILQEAEKRKEKSTKQNPFFKKEMIYHKFHKLHLSRYLHMSNTLKFTVFLFSNQYSSSSSQHFLGNKQIYSVSSLLKYFGQEVYNELYPKLVSKKFLLVDEVARIASKSIVEIFCKLGTPTKREGESSSIAKNLVRKSTLNNSIRFHFQKMKKDQYLFFLDAVEKKNLLSRLNDSNKITLAGAFGLGPREAKIEDRDIYPSHYGRLCLVQSPEGSNVGLVNYTTVHSRVNLLGQVESPYAVVKEGKVTNQVIYLTSQGEKHHIIALSSETCLKDGTFVSATILCRLYGKEYRRVCSSTVTLCEVGDSFILSPVGGFIPFVEHNDTTRILMGGNMQTQALELLKPERSLVQSGLEGPFSSLLSSSTKGPYGVQQVIDLQEDVQSIRQTKELTTFVNQFSAVTRWSDITSSQKESTEKNNLNHKDTKNNYSMSKNQDFLNSSVDFTEFLCETSHEVHKVALKNTSVENLQPVKGEISLGQNVLIGFVSSHGHTFEDSILVSDRLVKEGFFNHGKRSMFEDIGYRAKNLSSTILHRLKEKCGFGNHVEIWMTLLRNNCFYWSEPVVSVGQKVQPGDPLMNSYIQFVINPTLLQSLVRRSSKVHPSATEHELERNQREVKETLSFLWDFLDDQVKVDEFENDFEFFSTKLHLFSVFPLVITKPIPIYTTYFKGDREGEVVDMKTKVMNQREQERIPVFLEGFMTVKRKLQELNHSKCSWELHSLGCNLVTQEPLSQTINEERLNSYLVQGTDQKELQQMVSNHNDKKIYCIQDGFDSLTQNLHYNGPRSFEIASDEEEMDSNNNQPIPPHLRQRGPIFKELLSMKLLTDETKYGRMMLEWKKKGKLPEKQPSDFELSDQIQAVVEEAHGLMTQLIKDSKTYYYLLARVHELLLEEGCLGWVHELGSANISIEKLDLDEEKVSTYTPKLLEKWLDLIKELMDYYFFWKEEYIDLKKNPQVDCKLINFLQENDLYFFIRDQWIRENLESSLVDLDSLDSYDVSGTVGLYHMLEKMIIILIGTPYYDSKKQSRLQVEIIKQLAMIRSHERIEEIQQKEEYLDLAYNYGMNGLKYHFSKEENWENHSDFFHFLQKEYRRGVSAMNGRKIKTETARRYKHLNSKKEILTFSQMIELSFTYCKDIQAISCKASYVLVFENESLQPGDKLTGRFGNKGIVSRIMPSSEMPYLKDGTPLDIALNPLGVSSRMNLGQLLEAELGLIAGESTRDLQRQEYSPHFVVEKQLIRCMTRDKYMACYLDTLKGDDLRREIESYLHGNRFSMTSFKGVDFQKKINEQAFFHGINGQFKCSLLNPVTGELFSSPSTVGYMYMFKLCHTASIKMAARASGPVVMKTGQAVKGKKNKGGQKYGEMELACFQAHGAPSVLNEIFSLKSGGLGLGPSLRSNFNNRNPVQINSGSQTFSYFDLEYNALGGEFTGSKKDKDWKKRRLLFKSSD
uniref:DNA-directed RNA polymerase n=1 Tax=Jakoba libera TaxID=143017 RepID=M4QDJ6_JAKLI|nr:RNA polymerase subunit beta [Jakoba libera]AGH24225.1 RNA polymerase subunit beta [Jakoba libera]